MASVNDFSTSNQRQSALFGAGLGSPLGPGGIAVGGLLGLLVGTQKDVQEEGQRAFESQQRIQQEQGRFQAEARAQRLSLLQTDRRFAEDSQSQQAPALAPLAESGIEPITQAKSPLSPSGTF